MRARFDDLTQEERLRFGNGVGPHWLSDQARQFITQWASWFFEDASWRHHDFGYVVGGDRWDRARCDWLFFTAMWRDALSQPKWQILRLPLAMMIAVLFYLLVRIFGQFGSFKYRDNPLSIQELRAQHLSKKRSSL